MAESLYSSSAKVANRYLMMVTISWYLMPGSFISVCRFTRIRYKKYEAQWQLLRMSDLAFSCLNYSSLTLDRLVNMPIKSSIMPRSL